MNNKLSQTNLNNKENIKRNNSCLNKRRSKLYSLVGTPDYISPEVFSQIGYDHTCDWWSVGIILYEMLFGYPPFFSDNPKQTYKKILNWQKYFEFPNDIKVSNDAKDLIKRFICDKKTRLGLNGIEEIKIHPFFKGIDWKNIRKKRAPFVPNPKTSFDTKYFDNLKEKADIWWRPENTNKNNNLKFKDKLLFMDFNFKKRFNDDKKSHITDFLKNIDKKAIFYKSLASNKTTDRDLKNTSEISKKKSNNNSIINNKSYLINTYTSNKELFKKKSKPNNATNINNISKFNITNKFIINIKSPTLKKDKKMNFGSPKFTTTSKSPTKSLKKETTFNINSFKKLLNKDLKVMCFKNKYLKKYM